jgi:dihydrofolate synthase / folylpolyglutamate synthase
VGLGGRLDATNVVVPAVSVITPISLEHTALLGDTLGLIAREKAGIIKPGVPVVVAPQHAEALAAIEEVAVGQRARLVLVGRDWTWRSISDSVAGQTFAVASAASPWGTDPLTALCSPLLGAHQLANATTAIAACGELARQGVPISVDSLRRGLAQTVWPGRLEVLAEPLPGAGEAGLGQETGPSRGSVLEAGLGQESGLNGPRRVVVLDSAHNDASARLLRAALAHYFPGRSLYWIVGVSNDKDAAGILAELLPGAEGALLTHSRHPRAADPAELAPVAARYLPASRIRVVPTAPEALAQALGRAQPGTVICVAGSLFIASECREAWLALHPDSLPPGDWAYEAEPPAPGWQVAQTPSPAPTASVLDVKEVVP